MKRKNVQALLVGMAVMMSVILPTSPILAAENTQTEKEQTVYVTADENGKFRKCDCQQLAENKGKEKTLKDKSSLTDIENVKGDETFKQNSDGTLTWNTDGGDIYYQGTTGKKLPVSVKLTYYLDGKEIQASEFGRKKR